MKLFPRLLLLGVLCATLLSCTVARADDAMPRKIAFYAVERASCAPSANDRLTDECWEKAPAATTYYEYWKANPSPGQLRSEFRMLYDARGIYLKIVNFDKEMDKVRASIVRRDDPSLWTDDSAEIYFDPQANGVGFVNFTVNSLGVQSDRKRQDAAVMLNDWSGNEWRVATSKNADSWTIEAFFPWADLGAQANVGDIWKFDHVRFAWSSGKFLGTTWAPGGNYANPGNFGYLYFKGQEKLSPEMVGKILSASAPPPWMLPLDNEILLHPAPAKIELANATELAATHRAAFQTELEHAKAAVTQTPAAPNAAQKQLAELQAKAEAITFQDAAGALDAIEKIAALRSATEQTYWQFKTDALIESATVK